MYDMPLLYCYQSPTRCELVESHDQKLFFPSFRNMSIYVPDGILPFRPQSMTPSS